MYEVYQVLFGVGHLVSNVSFRIKLILQNNIIYKITSGCLQGHLQNIDYNFGIFYIYQWVKNCIV